MDVSKLGGKQYKEYRCAIETQISWKNIYIHNTQDFRVINIDNTYLQYVWIFHQRTDYRVPEVGGSYHKETCITTEDDVPAVAKGKANIELNCSWHRL
jgi:hypothetical protein